MYNRIVVVVYTLYGMGQVVILIGCVCLLVYMSTLVSVCVVGCISDRLQVIAIV